MRTGLIWTAKAEASELKLGGSGAQRGSLKKLIYEVRKMKNAILKICEKLRGYSETEPYFEVTEIKQNENGTYTVIVQVVDPVEEYLEEQGAKNESN